MKTASLLAALAVAGLPAAGLAQDDPVSVTGTFTPVNAAGSGVAGRVTLAASDGTLTIALDADGVSPGVHLAHIHGYATVDPREAVCPDATADATADANDDGVIDVIELRRSAGITMVPLTSDPASLKIAAEGYPEAGDDRALTWQKQVPTQALEDAVQSAYEGPLELPRRVVVLHGVPEATDLPDSVASLQGVPAYRTLPVACAELAVAER